MAVFVLILLVACRHPVDDTSDTSDTGRPPPPTFTCDASGLTPPSGLPAATDYADTAGDIQYRLVRIPSDLFDPFYVVVFFPEDPTATAYADGAPVVVSAAPAMVTKMTVVDALPSEFGFVEVQPLYPLQEMDGVASVGPADDTGLVYAEALAEVIRFAAGASTTVEGWSVGQVAGRPVCGPRVTLLTRSSGAFTGMAALDVWGDDLVDLVNGVGSYEPPSVVQMATGDLGWVWLDPDGDVDADGDGFAWDDVRDLSYAVGDCPAGSVSCALDYGDLRFTRDMTVHQLVPDRYDEVDGDEGVLYRDLNGDGLLTLTEARSTDTNGNGAHDADEDFFYTPHHDADAEPPTNVQFYAPELIRAALEQGVLSTALWPSGLAMPEATEAFWVNRGTTSHLLGLSGRIPERFRFVLAFTAEDHATSQPTRPTLWQIHETARQEGWHIRYNAADEALRCVMGDWALVDYAGSPTPDVSLDETAVEGVALPEDVPVGFAAGSGVLGVLWDTFGPFNRCPGTAR